MYYAFGFFEINNNKGPLTLGTIHLRRRQIFTIFDPYPPTIGAAVGSVYSQKGFVR